MKTLKEFLEARMIATGDFRISASGRKVRRLIKVGDDGYNKADDLDKDGDVDKDDRRLAKEEVEQIEEATVKSANYSWGTMKTVHHGKDFSIPLHPEHHKPIAALKHGESHSFKDETGNKWKATRDNDTVHFHGGSYGTQKTSVKHDTMKESVDKGEYDYEGQMARTQLQTICRNSTDLIAMLNDEDNMPEWVQSKITLAQDYITTVRDYLQSKEELDEQYLVHVSDGSKYDEKPHPKDVDHVMAGAKKHSGEFDGNSDKGAYFKFKSHDDAKNFKKHVDSCPNRSCSADIHESTEQVNEASDKQDSRLLQLARLGLLDKSNVALFRNAMQTFKADKQLSIKQRDMLLAVYNDLVNMVTGDDAMFARAKLDVQKEETDLEEGKRGLWDNIHAKRKRIAAGSGEKMRKPGSKGAPTAQDFKDASEETQVEGYYKDIDTNNKETQRLSGSWKKETPWRKIKPGSNVVTDKSGAKHTPMSRARHLARMALKKTDTK